MVAFSGGKDSLATLHLTRQVALERGITTPIEVVFRDEEIIPDVVLDFVNVYRELDWVNLRWLCVPLKSTRLLLGSISEYVQWDPNREWVRPMPAWALREADLGLEPGVAISQFTADDVTAAPFKGKVCVLTGIRAAESLMRYRACVNKLNDNYIVKSGRDGRNNLGSKRVTLGRPIYDWQEQDVFRYFYDEKIAYCPVYDQQGWAGAALRVSTMINVQTSKFLHVSKTYSPDLWEGVLRVFPEMAVQERYSRELDTAAMREEYGKDFAGVRAWIERFVTNPGQKRTALLEFQGMLKRANVDPEAYPPEYVLGCFITQNGSRMTLPLKSKGAA